MIIELGKTYRTLRNETVTVTAIGDGCFEGVIIASPDSENINQYDIFSNTTVIAEEIK